MCTPASTRRVTVGLVGAAAIGVLAASLSCHPVARRLAVAAPALGQEPSEPLTGALGRLYVYGTAGKAEPLEVRELRVRVHVAGPVAATEIEQTFFNPTDQRAEGTFYFPLPAGASISRLAMYVDGRLMEGELVERLRARQVYEEIVLRMRDPALMEWQEGNVFKTRVFPIPPRGPKRILIGYTQLLPIADGERRYIYPLVSKATRASRIGRFEFEATLSPAVQGGVVSVPDYPDATITPQADAAQVSLTRSDFAPARDLVLRFAPERSGELELLTDRRAGEDGFFLLSYLPPSRANGPQDGPKGRDWVLMVDTSLSRRADEYRAQMTAARLLLEQLGPDDRFAVITFDVEPRLHHDRLVSGRTAIDEALKALHDVSPLGGTNLGAAIAALDAFLAKASARSRPEVVLISDGIATLGETRPDKLLAQAKATLELRRVRLHALAFGSEVDRLVLQELAVEKGGLFRMVVPREEVEREVLHFAQAIRAPYLPNPDVSFLGSACDMYPERLGTLIGGGELIILGRYKLVASTTVSVRAGGRLLAQREVAFPETDSRHVFIPRLWARERLDALLRQPQSKETMRQIVQLSQEFTLITPYTSFLVLETADDYKRYGIDRRVRRRYWEEAGKLRTAPPPEEASPDEPPQPAQEKPSNGNEDEFARRWSEEDLAALRKARGFALGDLNLELLTPRYLNGREVATALAATCLGIFERAPAPQTTATQQARGRTVEWDTDDDEEVPSESDIGRALRGAAGAASIATRFADGMDASDLLALRGRGGVLEEFFGAEPDEEEDWASDVGASQAQRFARALEAQVQYHQALASDAGWSSAGFRFGRGGEMAQEFFGGDEEDSDATGLRLEDEALACAKSLGRDFRIVYEGGRLRVARDFGFFTSDGSRGRLTALEWLNSRVKDEADAATSVEAMSLLVLASLSELQPGVNSDSGQSAIKLADGAFEALARLIARQAPSGQIGSDAYEHALATYALCEATRAVKAERPRRAAGDALRRLAELQTRRGGQLRGWGDPLSTAWGALALASAREAGLAPPQSALAGAMACLDEITAANGAVGARGAPRGGEVHLLNTAAALAARAALGPRDDPKLVAGARLVLRRLSESRLPSPDGLYALFFTTEAMRRLRQPLSARWRTPTLGLLWSLQRQRGTEAGSWDPEGVWVRGRKPVPAVWLSSEEAWPRVEAALARVAAEPRSWDACEELCAALSVTDDVALLRRALRKAPVEPPHAAAIVHLRLGTVSQSKGRPGEGVPHFRAAYEGAGRPANVLLLYADALRRAAREREALELLLAEGARAGAMPSCIQLAATLLLDPAVVAGDPAAFASERIRGNQLAQAHLLFALSEQMGLAGRPDLQTALLREAYHGSGRAAILVQPYINALLAARAFDEATRELEDAILGGYQTPWAFGALALACMGQGRDAAAMLRAASCEVELFPRDAAPRLRFAELLEDAGRFADALAQYAEVARIRPEEHQPYARLIEGAVKLGRLDLAAETIERAAELGISERDIGLEDEERVLDLLKQAAARPKDAARSPELEAKIRRAFAKDLVVVASWDTDGTDVDLHVVEPDGAECYYENMRTKGGGVLDGDDTNGFGPETYTMRRAAPGAYRIELVYFSGSPTTTVTVRVYRNRNSQDEKTETFTATLTRAKQRATVATMEIPARK